MHGTLVADVDQRSGFELEGRSTAFKQHSVFDLVVFPSMLERWLGIRSISTERRRRRRMLPFPSLQARSMDVRWILIPMVGVSVVLVPRPGRHSRRAGNDGLGRDVLSRRQDGGVATRRWWRNPAYGSPGGDRLSAEDDGNDPY
jgi:hypothetical protein